MNLGEKVMVTLVKFGRAFMKLEVCLGAGRRGDRSENPGYMSVYQACVSIS